MFWVLWFVRFVHVAVLPYPITLPRPAKGLPVVLAATILVCTYDRRRLSSRRFLHLTRLPVFESRGRTTCGVIRRTAQCLTLGTKPLHQQSAQPLLPAAHRNAFQPVQEDRLQCHAGIELYYDSVPGFRLSHRRVVSLAADMEMDYANGVTTRQRKPDTLAVGVFDFGRFSAECR